MTANHKCLVCKGEDHDFSLKCKDNLAGKDNFDIYKCRICGFCFTMDPPSVEKITAYYDDEDYISHSDTSKGLINTLFHFTRSLMLLRKKKIITKATGLKTGVLLDIGCGTGYFASFMKERGWNVSGLEPNEKARDFAGSNFGLNVFSGTDNPELKENHFDCITLWHVLEHFHDPEKYLSFIHRSLKPGAPCIVALPNCGSFDAKHYQQHWAAWDVPRHLWHFNTETFRTFAENNGFKISKVKRLPADVFYISILSERYRGANMPFITGMIKGLRFSLLTLFNKKRSSSLIYILEPVPSS